MSGCPRAGGTRASGRAERGTGPACGSCATAPSRCCLLVSEWSIPGPCVCMLHLFSIVHSLHACQEAVGLGYDVAPDPLHCRQPCWLAGTFRYQCCSLKTVGCHPQAGRWRKGSLETPMEAADCALPVRLAQKAAAAAQRCRPCVHSCPQTLKPPRNKPVRLAQRAAAAAQRCGPCCPLAPTLPASGNSLRCSAACGDHERACSASRRDRAVLL